MQQIFNSSEVSLSSLTPSSPCSSSSSSSAGRCSVYSNAISPQSSSSATATPSSYTHHAALAAVNSLPVILENGRKVFGPPPNYNGPRPSYECELFIARVPELLGEVEFLVWLHRTIGCVYEFRLMMDSGHTTRGYAFVRFTSETQALAAFELLCFHFVEGERLSVFRSQGKNRLYVSNIPKQMPLMALEAGFRKTFPELQNCTLYSPRTPIAAVGEEMAQNRGYAFIEFYDHEQALEAKKRTTPGRVRMWGCDLKVQWAKPKETTTTLMKWCSAAGGGARLSAHRSPHEKNDYCDKLRLFCLANNWCIPVVLYGSNFRQQGVQYGGILLKSATSGAYAFVLAEVWVMHVYDLHVLLCELAVQLIERESGLPKLHYVLRVPNNTRAEIMHASSGSLYVLCNGLHSIGKYLLHVYSMEALATSLEILAQYPCDALLAHYKNSFLANTADAGLPLAMPLMHLWKAGDDVVQQPLAQFFAILPKFRNNLPLNNNFNDTEITLLQAAAFSGTNTFPISPLRLSRDKNFSNAAQVLRLKSQRINVDQKFVLQFVDAAMGRGFYHPFQRINSHPIWIRGHTYQKSIFEIN